MDIHCEGDIPSSSASFADSWLLFFSQQTNSECQRWVNWNQTIGKINQNDKWEGKKEKPGECESNCPYVL